MDWSITINAQFVSLQIGKSESITNSEIIFESLLKKASEGGKKVLITIMVLMPFSQLPRNVLAFAQNNGRLQEGRSKLHDGGNDKKGIVGFVG